MSLVNLANVCSHLQNVSKARLSMTSIPMTRLHLNLALSLQKQGFLSTVQVAGPSPPALPELSLPKDSLSLPSDLESQIQEEPWIGLAYNAAASEAISQEAVNKRRKSERDNADVPSNPAQRRIWLGMKYWNNEPVLSKMGLVSKPTRRIWMGVDDIAKITRGRRAGYVGGLTRVGECLFVSTDKGVYESRECVERTLGGMLLCRAA
ncbi:ribosomal protein S8 [Tothia fuscella]|uniref:Ribosomal protein S8 n=1 Tax=Tothia fuscella TaxID=1048955 RepID=A0A9P4P5X6_9PEZI|nr:ribosomal protein S8 [Tothia fuscella]